MCNFFIVNIARKRFTVIERMHISSTVSAYNTMNDQIRQKNVRMLANIRYMFGQYADAGALRSFSMPFDLHLQRSLAVVA